MFRHLDRTHYLYFALFGALLLNLSSFLSSEQASLSSTATPSCVGGSKCQQVRKVKSGQSEDTYAFNYSITKEDVPDSKDPIFDTVIKGGKQIDVSYEIEGCDCRDTITFGPESNFKSLDQLKDAISKQFDEIAKQKIAAVEKARLDAKEQARKDKLEAKKEKQRENCEIDDDGEKLKGEDKLNCMVDRVTDIDGDDKQAQYFTSTLAPILDQMLTSGNAAQQARARALYGKLASSGNDSIANAAQVSLTGGKYFDQIRQISRNNIQNPPMASAQLSMLGMQLNQEFSIAWMRNQNSEDGGSAVNQQLSQWQQTLNQDIQIASQNPGRFLSQNSFNNNNNNSDPYGPNYSDNFVGNDGRYNPIPGSPEGRRPGQPPPPSWQNSSYQPGFGYPQQNQPYYQGPGYQRPYPQGPGYGYPTAGYQRQYPAPGYRPYGQYQGRNPQPVNYQRL